MLEQYQRIFVIDTEFQKPDGEKTRPVCSTFLELYSGEVFETFFDEPHPCPVEWQATDLVVGYNLAAEWGVFIEAGWSIPEHMIDLYFVHLRELNGARENGLLRDFSLISQPAKLSSALTLIGRPDLIHEDKTGERAYVIANGVAPPPGVTPDKHKRRVLDYCMTDVVATAVILAAFEKVINEHFVYALIYSKFSLPVVWFERNGIPMDAPLVEAIRKHRKALIVHLISELEAKYKYGVFDANGVRKAAAFTALVNRLGLAERWPTTDAGAFRADKETMKDMARIDPTLEPLRELLKYLPQLRSNKLQCGSDGRSRPSVWPLKLKSGRCSPGGDCILGQPAGMRRLMKAPEGYAIVDVDASQEEFILAGVLSGDPTMQRIYATGKCIYLSLAQENGAIPPDGTKSSHPKQRALWKTVQLAGQYGIGGVALSQRLGLNSPMKAEEMLSNFRNTYKTYFAWSDRQIDQAYRQEFITSPLGWRLWVSRKTKRNSLLNFPVQSAGGDVLRVACILAVERGLGPYLCYPHHDAIYCCCPINHAAHVGQVLRECFADAGRLVTGNEEFELRCGEPDIFPYPERYVPAEDKGNELWELVVNFIEANELVHVAS